MKEECIQSMQPIQKQQKKKKAESNALTYFELLIRAAKGRRRELYIASTNARWQKPAANANASQHCRWLFLFLLSGRFGLTAKTGITTRNLFLLLLRLPPAAIGDLLLLLLLLNFKRKRVFFLFFVPIDDIRLDSSFFFFFTITWSIISSSSLFSFLESREIKKSNGMRKWPMPLPVPPTMPTRCRCSPPAIVQKERERHQSVTLSPVRNEQRDASNTRPPVRSPVTPFFSLSDATPLTTSDPTMSPSLFLYPFICVCVVALHH